MNIMQRNLIAGAVLGLLLGLAIPWLLLRPEAQAQQPDKVQKWEYKVVSFRGANDAKIIERSTQRLNELAEEGWEYVGPVSNYSKTYGGGDVESFGYVAFRRPKK
jgi:hypothetical protein